MSVECAPLTINPLVIGATEFHELIAPPQLPPHSAAAHTVILSVAMFCFTLGDVGSSLSQAFLPAYSKKPREGGGGEPTFDLKAAMPAIRYDRSEPQRPSPPLTPLTSLNLP